MKYPIAIEPSDKSHAYGVVVPDLPGCFSAGDTIELAWMFFCRRYYRTSI